MRVEKILEVQNDRGAVPGAGHFHLLGRPLDTGELHAARLDWFCRGGRAIRDRLQDGTKLAARSFVHGAVHHLTVDTQGVHVAKKRSKTVSPGNTASASAIGAGGETHQVAAASEQSLTTNQGTRIADNQNSLKIGDRGPTLLEDFILLEKITHFDHERIPERIVHARGSGAHGYFQPTKSLAHLTKAAFLQDPKKRTEVFVRFSTVAGAWFRG
jgi:hypothetical protein